MPCNCSKKPSNLDPKHRVTARHVPFEQSMAFSSGILSANLFSKPSFEEVEQQQPKKTVSFAETTIEHIIPSKPQEVEIKKKQLQIRGFNHMFP